MTMCRCDGSLDRQHVDPLRRRAGEAADPGRGHDAGRLADRPAHLCRRHRDRQRHPGARGAKDWDHFDRSHRPDCRLVAREQGARATSWDGSRWTAYSSRRVYSGVAWESVYVATEARGRGVGRALLEAVIPASERAGMSGRCSPVSWPRTRPVSACHEIRGLSPGRRAAGTRTRPWRALAGCRLAPAPHAPVGLVKKA